MTSSPWCILQSKGIFLLVLVEYFTVQGDESPGDYLPLHPAPAYPIVQKPVSNLKGLLEDFLSWDFNFPICPNAEFLQILPW